MIKAVRGMLAVASCLGISHVPSSIKTAGGGRKEATDLVPPRLDLQSVRASLRDHFARNYRDTLRTVGLLSRQKVECLQCQYYIDQPAVCLTEL